ncbi:hypothetical protein [Parabacteroides sp.]
MVRIYTLLYIYTFFALGAFCSCEPEAIDGGRDMRPVEGTYVIDYTFEGTRTSTRSIHQDQPANQRISSLTYLLYGKDGESKESMLLKRREIPDISKDTKWPLKRETMTWGQREALKDTLEQGMDYKVVFVANIDSSIVKWTADGTPNGTLWCPLREAESFSAAYLQLPVRPFTDSDMFYLFTSSVNSEDKGADRDHPYNCPVLLQRVVTRTDFFTERLPEWDMTIKEGKIEIPDTVKTYFQPALIPLYSKLIMGGTDAHIFNSAKGSTTNLLNAMKEAFSAEQKKWTPTDPTKTDSVNTAAKYGKYAGGMLTISNNLDQDPTPIISVLSGKSAIPLVGSLLETSLRNDFIQILWKQSWRMDADHKTPTTQAEVVYGSGSGANRIFLDRTAKAGLSTSARIPVDTTYISELQQGFFHRFEGFSLISYGLPGQNKITAIKWYASDGTTHTLTQELQTNQGGNEWYQVTYRPIHSLDCLGNPNPIPVGMVCDINTLLPLREMLPKEGEETSAWTDEEVEALRAAMIGLLNTDDFKAYKYTAPTSDGTGETITLPVGVPDLSADDALQINSEWKVEKHR